MKSEGFRLRWDNKLLNLAGLAGMGRAGREVNKKGRKHGLDAPENAHPLGCKVELNEGWPSRPNLCLLYPRKRTF